MALPYGIVRATSFWHVRRGLTREKSLHYRTYTELENWRCLPRGQAKYCRQRLGERTRTQYVIAAYPLRSSGACTRIWLRVGRILHELTAGPDGHAER
jgi:hypothetical protein